MLYFSPYTGLIVVVLMLMLFVIFYFSRTPFNFISLINVEQKSPVVGFLASTYSGLTTISLFKQTEFFSKEYQTLLRNSARAFFTKMMMGRLLRLYIDMFSLVFGLTVLLIVSLTVQKGGDPYYGQMMVGVLMLLDSGQFSFKLSIFVSGIMISPKRLFQFEDIPQEKG